ncbi:HesA/MoeB/ThiF family protein [Halopiger aswanensis]|uniref:Molybdopterin/thiamine biosynthesis adenylyltransferase n=1 Tax=Halopiger aswanensis TaxID=148449 RepID=A0A419VVS0_9EURY|nr:ThiF family adenylyltransferase [Halopiger aswanensis]RKD86233.1 molybdopterin/thiamine biosynthesis adenylyltransferase [Halopiger aswanensis]
MTATSDIASETVSDTVTDEYELVLTATQVRRLREWLLRDDGIERFAYVYCTPEDGRLFAREIDPVPGEDCEVQEEAAVRPALSVERERLGSALEDGLVPVMLHSHPFSDYPSFSGLDDDIMESYREWLGGLYPDTPLCFGVLGHRGMDTAVYIDPQRETRRRLPVEVVGDWALEGPLDAPTAPTTATVDEDRYDRSIRALTERGQQRLADRTIGIVGLGGLGSIVATQLARLGVRRFVFSDPDHVERSNLPRIYGATEADVGRPKVEVVSEHVVRANPEASVDAYEARVQDVPKDALAACDVLIGAVDRLTARLYCNEFAIRHLRHYVDAGVSIETTDDGHITEERGLVQLVAPGVTGCLDCLGRNDPERLRLESMDEAEIEADIERGYLDEDVRSPEPAITPLNALAANTTVRMVTKLVTGYEAPADYVRLDGTTNEMVSVGTHPSRECLTCGTDGCLGEGTQRIDEDTLAEAESLDLDVDLEELAEQDATATPTEITADSLRPAAPRPGDDAGPAPEIDSQSQSVAGGWYGTESPPAAEDPSGDDAEAPLASASGDTMRDDDRSRSDLSGSAQLLAVLRTNACPIAIGCLGVLALWRYLRR